MREHVAQQDKIRALASESIEVMGVIADKAKQEISTPRATDVLANDIRSITGAKDAKAVLSRIDAQKAESFRWLMQEPVIARIIAENGDGKEEVYFITRTMPPSVHFPNVKLVSYRAPLGKLAATPSGEEARVLIDTKLKAFEVVERVILHPKTVDGGWDSIDSVLDTDAGIQTISSLRALLAQFLGEKEAEDVLAQLLGEEQAAELVFEGKRRRVIERMELRDQPILDKYQDEIFRMPLDSQLLITGPPGTGKTTTLIRRLGQKLDRAFCTSEECQLLEAAEKDRPVKHEQSWIMFSPTTLLALYVKEAFNREGIPAPDDRIKTWSDTRLRLARDIMKILRTGNGGLYTLRDDGSILKESTVLDTIGFFNDYEEYFLQDAHNRLNQAATILSEAKDPQVTSIAAKVLKTLSSAKKKKAVVPKIDLDAVIALFRLAKEIEEILKAYSEDLKETATGWLRRLLGQDRKFLDDLVVFLSTLKEDASEDSLDDDEDDDDVEEDEETPLPVTAAGRRLAQREFERAMRALAKSKLTKKAPAKKTKAVKVIEWLSTRSPGEEELVSFGQKYNILSKLRLVSNPVRIFLNHVPSRYQAYRRLRLKEDRWFGDGADGAIRKRTITGLETDLLLLLMLKHSAALYPRLKREIDTNAKLSLVKATSDEYKNQVLVDEATDFSPVQLACMFHLGSPNVRSFFACGDMYQRVTPWGVRTSEQLKWVSPKIAIQPMVVMYRQSKQLADLAEKIAMIGADSRESTAVGIIPKDVDSDCDVPVLGEMLKDDALVTWIRDRIFEVEGRLGKVPSVAIFVHEERAVLPLATAVEEALRDHSIRVSPCPMGQVVGSEEAVRVFDVQHIKGLEFEAVFFVGVDKLADKVPDLFNKFLYVGATRAATYLGMTCHETLPPLMEELRPLFGDTWAS